MNRDRSYQGRWRSRWCRGWCRCWCRYWCCCCRCCWRRSPRRCNNQINISGAGVSVGIHHPYMPGVRYRLSYDRHGQRRRVNISGVHSRIDPHVIVAGISHLHLGPVDKVAPRYCKRYWKVRTNHRIGRNRGNGGRGGCPCLCAISPAGVEE